MSRSVAPGGTAPQRLLLEGVGFFPGRLLMMMLICLMANSARTRSLYLACCTHAGYRVEGSRNTLIAVAVDPTTPACRRQGLFTCHDVITYRCQPAWTQQQGACPRPPWILGRYPIQSPAPHTPLHGMAAHGFTLTVIDCVYLGP